VAQITIGSTRRCPPLPLCFFLSLVSPCGALQRLGLPFQRTGLIRWQSARAEAAPPLRPQRRTYTPRDPNDGGASLPAPSLVRGRSPPKSVMVVQSWRSRRCDRGGAGAPRQEEQKARRGRSRGATMGGEGDTMVGGAGRLVTGDSAALAFDESIFLLAATVASRLCSSLGASSRGGCPCSRTRRRLPTMPTTGSHYRPPS
jgi:hypothetical protein